MSVSLQTVELLEGIPFVVTSQLVRSKGQGGVEERSAAEGWVRDMGRVVLWGMRSPLPGMVNRKGLRALPW